VVRVETELYVSQCDNIFVEAFALRYRDSCNKWARCFQSAAATNKARPVFGRVVPLEEHGEDRNSSYQRKTLGVASRDQLHH
jgi:hypothetical protein